MSEQAISAAHVTRLLSGETLSLEHLSADVVENSTRYGLVPDAAGLRLPTTIEPLQAERLAESLSARARAAWPVIDVLPQCPSTNSQLLEAGLAACGRVLTTEFQSAGRGRRGREWISPIGRNLAISVAWEAEGGFESFAGLSLVVGLALVDALQSLGLEGARLKWPNDLLAPDSDAGWGKLGGILVELQQCDGRYLAVIGFGLNYDSAALTRAQIEQPLADVHELRADLSRHQLAAACLNSLADYLAAFAQRGFAPLREAWEAQHMLHGACADVLIANQRRSGRVLGVTERGELRLQTGDGEAVFDAGEVSLRAASADGAQ